MTKRGDDNDTRFNGGEREIMVKNGKLGKWLSTSSYPCISRWNRLLEGASGCCLASPSKDLFMVPHILSDDLDLS